MPVIKIKGDLIELMKLGEYDVVLHNCNCQNTWGAGFALALKNQYPAAYEADMRTTKGSESKLGRFSRAVVGDLTIVNMYAQFDYGKEPGHCYLNYIALRKALALVYKAANTKAFKGKRIALPMIGSGLAGGNPDIIKGIINNIFFDMDIYMVDYKPKGTDTMPVKEPESVPEVHNVKPAEVSEPKEIEPVKTPVPKVTKKTVEKKEVK